VLALQSVRCDLDDRLAGLAVHGEGVGTRADRPDGLRTERRRHGV
jgi:hypothetical protein